MQDRLRILEPVELLPTARAGDGNGGITEQNGSRSQWPGIVDGSSFHLIERCQQSDPCRPSGMGGHPAEPQKAAQGVQQGSTVIIRERHGQDFLT